MYIQASCILALSRMIIQRPDIFMVDKFLMYLGWMFTLGNLIGKFLLRITDCVIDTNMSVQENAMKFVAVIIKRWIC